MSVPRQTTAGNGGTLAVMHDDFDACYRALASRDPRFDGRFFTGVTTTGIYCRPVCPAPLPRRENVRFLPSAAAAERAGLRPCRRCRPEDAAPTRPEWRDLPPAVRDALRLVDAGYLDGHGVAELARATHLSERQLRRAFVRALGAPPQDIARARRAHAARRLLDGTDASMAEVAALAGYRSLRTFNAEVRATFGATPRRLRAGRPARPADGAGGLHLRLSYRPPLDATALLDFLGPRCVTGVEEVRDGVYRRVAEVAGRPVVVALAFDESRHQVVLTAPAAAVPGVGHLVAATRRLFDLDADALAVAAHLGDDPVLADAVTTRPGMRVPGVWSPFESAVRAILGQQVSVTAATTLACRLAERAGTAMDESDGTLRCAFPGPAAVACADLTGLGLTGARARTLQALAERVADGRLDLDPARPPGDVCAELLAVPGVGPWTAQYVAMRGLRDPDAFPAGDLGVRRALADADGTLPTVAAVTARAEAWRPWRAYATLHLWTKGTG